MKDSRAMIIVIIMQINAFALSSLSTVGVFLSVLISSTLTFTSN